MPLTLPLSLLGRGRECVWIDFSSIFNGLCLDESLHICERKVNKLSRFPLSIKIESLHIQ
jgi:hypothetical protein